ncbi:hypothetical protein [Roseisolibacter agri]|uniref:Uncharacterized protein n=1 Tax=Roseisolibacter agri TaxID=2014610 RepID=A0AA37V8P7_9BACT|nr:hypothetical protein [Roseisolibacter agri]GLC23653.1 hypothetical protein rosag_01660 [Roseisolibacter agri]
MPTLHLHLREGFVGERVVVHADDAVVLDEPNVRTRTQLGLAVAREVTVPAGAMALRVELPGRGRTHTVRVNVARTPYVGVSVDAAGEMDVVCTAEAFGYV